jgi:tryptophanyl-tRNA synthetase
MSKSYHNQIDVADSPDEIRKKVRSMITDPLRIRMADAGHPEDCNVCQWYKVFCAPDYETVADKCRNSKWGCTDCKKALAEILVTFLSEPREKRADLEAHPERLHAILADGAEKARAAARATLDVIKEATGLGKM